LFDHWYALLCLGEKVKVVIRLLDEEKQLLGWGEVVADAKGDGTLCSTTPRIEIPIERAGMIAFLNSHWVDLNVNLSIPQPKSVVEVGQIFSLRFIEPIFRIPSSEPSLPAVTIRSSAEVEVPTGHLGVVVH
jgi:hypothetical protein